MKFDVTWCEASQSINAGKERKGCLTHCDHTSQFSTSCNKNFLCSDLLFYSCMTFVFTAGDCLGAKEGLAKLKYFVNIEEELIQMLAVE